MSKQSLRGRATDIEIAARPPGKELRNISLFSGGEKALTRVALLMAIFQYRPSPFCVLDDAAAAIDSLPQERLVQLGRALMSAKSLEELRLGVKFVVTGELLVVAFARDRKHDLAVFRVFPARAKSAKARGSTAAMRRRPA